MSYYSLNTSYNTSKFLNSIEVNGVAGRVRLIVIAVCHRGLAKPAPTTELLNFYILNFL
jgi:hypothetical protein